MVLWADSAHSAETLVSQVGAIKAGVVVVAFDEKDSKEALHHALSDSRARGLLFSADIRIQENKADTRYTYLQELIPELGKYKLGDELDLQSYPYLKSII